MNQQDLIRAIEEHGEKLVQGRQPVKFDVDLRSERITIRLTPDEARALDRLCRRYGVGRSTLIRMTLRQILAHHGELEIAGHDEAVAAAVERGGSPGQQG